MRTIPFNFTPEQKQAWNSITPRQRESYARMRTFRPAHLCNALLVMWASANNPNSYNKESGHAFDRWLNAIPKGTQFTYGQALDELSEFEWYGETSHIKSFVKKAEKAGRVRLQIRGKGKRPNVFIKL